MGDILELIKSRRNIKYFLPKFVSWENISRIIDAGRHAPSCGNIQNWKFICVLDPKEKQQLANATHEQYEVANAGVLIVVCGLPETAERYYGLRGERLYTIQNCAAAIENMLLEAHSLGLGTCWIGAFDEEEVKEICRIPEEVRPQAIVAVGYAREIPPKPSKFPMEAVTYFHRWRGKMRDPAKYLNDIAMIIGRKREAAKEAVHHTTQSLLGKAKDALKGVTTSKEKTKEDHPAPELSSEKHE